MSSKIHKYILPILLFVFLLILYIHNLSRSVYGGDSGDFISTAIVMGVPHPPGYPLFTLLGFLLTRINILTPAFMVGFISAFSSALSVVIFYLISLKLTKNKLASFIASLVLAFNFQFWFYSEIAEVFTLNILLCLVLIYLAILFYGTKRKIYFFAISFFVGLSLTNHHTAVLIFPSVAIISFKEFLKFVKDRHNLIKAFALFLLGFSVYLYVFIASFFHPVINWVPVSDWDSFLRLFLRKDYGTFNAGPFLVGGSFERLTVIRLYFKEIIGQLTIPSILLILAGFIFYFKNNKIIFSALLLGFLLSGPLFIGYAGFPLTNAFLVGVSERFIILSLVIILLFLPFGLIVVGNLISKIFKKNTYEKLFIGLFLIIPFSLFYYNFPKTDLSKITIGDDFAYDYLSFLPKNSFLILGGDTPLLNTWYVHYGLNYRKDVEVININQLKYNKYYTEQRSEYLKNNPKEESNVNLKIKIFEYIAKKRPVFAYDSINPVGKFEKISWVPYGLVNKLFLATDILPPKKDYFSQTTAIWDNLRYFKNLKKQENYLSLGSAGISGIPFQYANSLLLTGNYVLSQYQDKNSALAFFDSAKKLSPGYYKSYQILGVYYLSEKECHKAKDNLKKAIEIYPFGRDLYYFLYYAYNNCLKDKNSANKVIADYKNIFKSDFFKDIEKEIKNQ